MTTEYEERRGHLNRAGIPVITLFALILGATFLGLFLHSAHEGLAGRLASLITGRTETYVSLPDVVEHIQRLNRLETVSYSLDTVVENRESNPLLPDVLAGDKLLMIVHGQTMAGIDFAALKTGDVQISGTGAQGRSIRIRLPRSQVFSTSIDNARTRVYARDTGLFVAADPNLETATRLKAQAELQASAVNDGILTTASVNARDTVRTILEGLGFAKVEVQ